MSASNDSVQEPDAIECYLDELAARLAGRTIELRRILIEAEGHLRQAAEAIEAGGATAAEAEIEAVTRFGSAGAVAARFDAPPGKLTWSTLREMLAAAALLCGIGLAAIGLSGAVAEAMGAMFGKAFVAGDPVGVTYTRARCADYLEYQPHARSCTAAAVAHHFDEVVSYRAAAGLLGLVVLAGWFLWRRRQRSRGVPAVGALPEGFVSTISACLFGIAGAALFVLGGGQAMAGAKHGGGDNLSAALVSMLVALACVRPVLRTITSRAAVLGRTAIVAQGEP